MNVTRYGSLDSDVSVYYATSDLTANAGEDYVAMQNRLMWAAENADVKQVKIMVLKNSGIAEGEEVSFHTLCTVVCSTLTLLSSVVVRNHPLKPDAVHQVRAGRDVPHHDQDCGQG